jgi:CcmD family protein
MSTGAQYVVAAYAVIWFVLLLYVVVLGAKTSRIARELEVVARLAEAADHPPRAAPESREERATERSR